MRALRYVALAAALVVPAAAAHAQFSVYVGPPVHYAAPVYGSGYGIVAAAPGYWAYGPAGRYWVRSGWVGYRDLREHRDWDDHRFRYDHERDHYRRW